MHVSMDGVSVHYERREGAGTPVLLLHGWEGSTASFTPLTEYLEKRGNEVIIVDFPGHGQSDPPNEVWSVNEYASFLNCFMDLLDLPKCDVIAHSFGARVAILLAATIPQRFSKIVLTGAAGILPKRGFKYFIKTYAYKLGKWFKRFSFINALFKLDEKMAVAGSEEYQRLSGTMRGSYVKIVNQNLRPYLKDIQSPVLLVWGDKDQSTPLWMGQIMEQEIPDAGLVVFNGATHFAYLEQFQRFCLVIDAFLRR